MSQRLFNFNEALPPHNRTDTSKAAAIADTAPKMRQRVYDHLLRHGPLTNEQIARDTGIRLQTVCARVNKLCSLGLVADSGIRRPGDSGRAAKVWVAGPS